MNNVFLRDETMRFLQSCRGREKAMPRSELLHHLQLWDQRLSDRHLRDIYAELPVCTCPDWLFIPRTIHEVLDFQEYISKAHGPILAAKRVKTIYAFYPNLRPIAGIQPELF